MIKKLTVSVYSSMINRLAGMGIRPRHRIDTSPCQAWPEQGIAPGIDES
jgi:hypothetical protein